MHWMGQKTVVFGRRTKKTSHNGRFLKKMTMNEVISASLQMVDKTACLAIGM
jgi:hypothetical protein